MPDLLVLSRDYKTGELKMSMEIDQDPKVLKDDFKNLPIPNIRRERPTFSEWTREHEEDVAWLQDQIEYYLSSHDWGLDVNAEINWTKLMRDVEEYAYDTRRR